MKHVDVDMERGRASGGHRLFIFMMTPMILWARIWATLCRVEYEFISTELGGFGDLYYQRMRIEQERRHLLALLDSVNESADYTDGGPNPRVDDRVLTEIEAYMEPHPGTDDPLLFNPDFVNVCVAIRNLGMSPAQFFAKKENERERKRANNN